MIRIASDRNAHARRRLGLMHLTQKGKQNEPLARLLHIPSLPSTTPSPMWYGKTRGSCGLLVFGVVLYMHTSHATWRHVVRCTADAFCARVRVFDGVARVGTALTVCAPLPLSLSLSHFTLSLSIILGGSAITP